MNSTLGSQFFDRPAEFLPHSHQDPLTVFSRIGRKCASSPRLSLQTSPCVGASERLVALSIVEEAAEQHAVTICNTSLQVVGMLPFARVLATSQAYDACLALRWYQKASLRSKSLREQFQVSSFGNRCAWPSGLNLQAQMLR